MRGFTTLVLGVTIVGIYGNPIGQESQKPKDDEAIENRTQQIFWRAAGEFVLRLLMEDMYKHAQSAEAKYDGTNADDDLVDSGDDSDYSSDQTVYGELYDEYEDTQTSSNQKENNENQKQSSEAVGDNDNMEEDKRFIGRWKNFNWKARKVHNKNRLNGFSSYPVWEYTGSDADKRSLGRWKNRMWKIKQQKGRHRPWGQIQGKREASKKFTEKTAGSDHDAHPVKKSSRRKRSIDEGIKRNIGRWKNYNWLARRYNAPSYKYISDKYQFPRNFKRFIGRWKNFNWMVRNRNLHRVPQSGRPLSYRSIYIKRQDPFMDFPNDRSDELFEGTGELDNPYAMAPEKLVLLHDLLQSSDELDEPIEEARGSLGRWKSGDWILKQMQFPESNAIQENRFDEEVQDAEDNEDEDNYNENDDIYKRHIGRWKNQNWKWRKIQS